MTIKRLLIPFILSALCTTGCASPTTQGAQAIFPEQTADSSSAWIYINASDKEFTGVYRCTDREGKVMCRRAPLIIK